MSRLGRAVLVEHLLDAGAPPSLDGRYGADLLRVMAAAEQSAKAGRAEVLADVP